MSSVELEPKKIGNILVILEISRRTNISQKLSFQTVDYIQTMSSADKLKARAKKHEQAALDARQKEELAREKKEKKLAEKRRQN